MEIPVLVEPVAGNGYVARTGPPFNWTAEGATAEEALTNLRGAAATRMANGATVATLAVPAAPTPHPLLRWAGTWDPNDPVIAEWKRAVEEYRREVDNDHDRL